MKSLSLRIFDPTAVRIRCGEWLDDNRDVVRRMSLFRDTLELKRNTGFREICSGLNTRVTSNENEQR